MGSNDNIYDKLQDFLGMEESNINVLEESIDSNIQLEYFECSRNITQSRSEVEILQDKDCLFDLDLSIDKKKNTLIELASVNNIEAYRTIEKYLNQPNIKLYEWAILALQESKLNLECQLLDESKVLITTGLGGKGQKLRYFIVLFTPDGNVITGIQQQIIIKELEYQLRLSGSELEDYIFEDSFASILCMIPLKTPPKPLFKSIIEECNFFGDFLYNDFIITNVKALNVDEITELLAINNIY